LVSRNFLNQLSVDVGLDTFIETSANTSRSKSIFGDAFEALIGAIYLDKGYKTCRKFVLEKVIIDYVDVDRLIEEETDFKSKLGEWVQKNKALHEYKITENNRGKFNTYTCELFINDQKQANAEERSKKKAEQQAAKAFFSKMSEEHK
jgi:ribonuclease-3